MRIAIILAQRLGLTGSGIFSINLAQGLRLCGHDVRLLVAGSLSDSLQQMDLNITTVPFGDEGGPNFPIPGMSDVMPYKSSVFSQMTSGEIEQYLNHWEGCIRDFLKADFDIVHVNHWWLVASLVVKLAQIPVVVTLHGTDIEQWLRCNHLVQTVRLDDLHPHCFHAVSKKVKNSAIKLGIEVADNAVIIPPPYREDIFYVNPTAHVSRKGSLFVGKLSEQKGLVELLSAFREVKVRFSNAQLTLIGSSPNSHKWAQFAQSIGIREGLQFRGFIEQQALAKEYRSAEVVVISSWDEGYSLVSVEAACCGAPILMPRYGAADLILSDCLSSPHLYLIDKLLDNSESTRKDFHERLVSAWINALSCRMEVSSAVSRECLYQKASRPAVAEKMISSIYEPLLHFGSV